jgi:hypothetical protein
VLEGRSVSVTCCSDCVLLHYSCTQPILLEQDTHSAIHMVSFTVQHGRSVDEGAAAVLTACCICAAKSSDNEGTTEAS